MIFYVTFFQAGIDSPFQALLGDNSFPRHESKRVKRDQGNEETSANEVNSLEFFFFNKIILKGFIIFMRSWRI